MATAGGREHWSSKSGFVLAAIGSAVGLGNMWRFSYLAAENGGAAFVALYVVLTLSIGLPLLLAELTIGRGAQKSPVRALVHYGGEAWKPLGLVFVAAGFLILAYYSVIAGWTVRYAGMAIFSGFGSDIADRFDGISQGWAAFGYHLAFMVVVIAIVAGGVRSGIERSATLLMPALFVVLIGLAIYAATLPGSGAGYAYYLSIDFSKAIGWKVLGEAAGHAFFSLSLGMGAMLTYASYLDRDHDLPSESTVIAGADVAVAFVAGLVVFPLIFALGLTDAVGESTLGALFITLPQAFAEMGAAGRIVGPLFFVTLIVGALTSAISLLEVVTSSAMDGLGWTRRRAALSMGAVIAALGAWCAFDIRVLDLADTIAGKVLLLSGGLALSLFVGWAMEDATDEAGAGAGADVAWLPLWRTLLRFVVPAFLAFVLFFQAIPETWGKLVGLFG